MIPKLRNERWIEKAFEEPFMTGLKSDYDDLMQ